MFRHGEQLVRRAVLHVAPACVAVVGWRVCVCVDLVSASIYGGVINPLASNEQTSTLIVDHRT